MDYETCCARQPAFFFQFDLLIVSHTGIILESILAELGLVAYLYSDRAFGRMTWPRSAAARLTDDLFQNLEREPYAVQAASINAHAED
jgi:hypothetical protein